MKVHFQINNKFLRACCLDIIDATPPEAKEKAKSAAAAAKAEAKAAAKAARKGVANGAPPTFAKASPTRGPSPKRARTSQTYWANLKKAIKETLNEDVFKKYFYLSEVLSDTFDTQDKLISDITDTPTRFK